MSFTFLSVRPERFDFSMLDIAAQHISQSDDIRTREFVETIALSIVCVDALGMRPPCSFFAERREQGKLQLVTRSGMQDKSEGAQSGKPLTIKRSHSIRKLLTRTNCN